MTLAVAGGVKRRAAAVRYILLPITGLVRVVLQLDFTPAMTEEPAPRVVGLVDGNAVHPGLQRTLSPEIRDVAEHFLEHFLHHIAGFSLIPQQTQCEGVDRLLETLDQFLVGPFGAVTQVFHYTQVFSPPR